MLAALSRTPPEAAMLPLLLALLAGSVAGLDVKPLAIVDDRRYISFGLGPSENNSVLLCAYTLDEGQAVSGVLWEILKEEVSAGTFEWKPNAPAIATGLLKDKVNLERDDSDLELTTLTYELSANYSCTVTADDGTTASARDEILIIATTSTRYSYRRRRHAASTSPSGTSPCSRSRPSSPACTRRASVDLSAPDDAIFRCELGVTKANGTVISQSVMTSHFQFRHSCKILPVGENQTVSYNTDDRTCYGEPYQLGTVEARVECAGGFVSGGNVTSVTMVCDSVNATTHRWIPGDEGLLPEDLVCEGAAMRVTSCYALLTATLLLCFLSR
ncbi:uncharacterized protein LOC134774568 isoform X2 [Penaeus indicus]|uniref:uncharacterized protein LOC134774568 isoform X2 n=1 Tax=Penaeus indicus TaxID=29960 RepID=UPI00300CADF6